MFSYDEYLHTDLGISLLVSAKLAEVFCDNLEE